MTEPALANHPDYDATAALEVELDEAIAACDGDARATVRVLLVANRYLEAEVEALQRAVSAGFSRGRVRSSRLKA
jgi:hypothetical protein